MRMKNRRLLLRLTILMVGLIMLATTTACAGSKEKSAGSAPSAEVQHDRAQSINDSSQSAYPPVDGAENSYATSTGEGKSADPFTSRMVMYNVRISAEVANYAEARKQIENQINTYQGYIVRSAEYRGENHAGASMTVRVPQQHMNEFIQFVAKLSLKITHEIEGQDVTEEYVDLSSRLKAKEAMEARLFDFMGKAEKAEDLLKISQELGRVQEEIEQIKGRIKYLQEHTSYATIDLSLSEKKTTVETPDAGTLTKAWQAFIDSSNNVVSFFVGLFILLIGMIPFLLVLLAGGVPLFLVLRRIHKRQKKEAAAEKPES